VRGLVGSSWSWDSQFHDPAFFPAVVRRSLLAVGRSARWPQSFWASSPSPQTYRGGWSSNSAP